MLRAGEHPTQLHNNCSGKHAAMLAFAKHIGADLATYDSFDHPVQHAILSTVAEFAEVAESDIALAVDGCAAPNFAISIESMARSFINLIDPARFDENTRNACRRLVTAMTKFPELIGGIERLDTMLMQAAGGTIISKVGADGVWLCGVLPSENWPTGLAIALKIEDGNDLRARPVVAADALVRLGVLDPAAVSELLPMQVRNRRGDVVGRVEPSLSF